MPYTVAQLSSALLTHIAPGNSAEFLRLLGEADNRLLEMGKWQWCREVIQLTPDNGILTLPVSHTAILSARVDGTVKEVHSREAEFMIDQGEILVEGGGSYRLYDQGLSTVYVTEPAMVLTVDGDDLFPDPLKGVYEPTGNLLNGRPEYQSVDFPTVLIQWYDGWVFNSIGEILWRGDSSNPLSQPQDVVQWTEVSTDPEITGFPIVTATVSDPGVLTTVRTYKIHGGIGLTEPLSVLASKAPAPIVGDSSLLHCPSLSALKLAMMAIIYEEASDRDRAQAYWSDALVALSDTAVAIQGGATQLRPSRTKRGYVSRPFYNFP